MSVAARKILCLFLLASFIAMAASIWIPNHLYWINRAKVDHARQGMRTVATALDEFPLAELVAAQNGVYWGPLSPAMLEKLKLPADEIIDPFNRDPPESNWRTGHYYADDGASFTPRGGDFQFYSDGVKFWMIVSRGPDGVLSLTPEAIRNAASNASDLRLIGAAMVPYTYDPSNGTISAGDVWREASP